MDKEQLLEEVVSQIRACLISTKGKCDLRQIKNDYHMIMGCDIPHTQLGFKTLEQLICSVPTLTTTRLNGQLFVDAKVTEKSSHISDFVKKQKPSKKKRPPTRQVFKKDSSVPARWRPKNNNRDWQQSFEKSPRLAAVAHTQVVSSTRSPEKKTVVRQDNSLTRQAKQRLMQKMVDLTCEDTPPKADTALQVVDLNKQLDNKWMRTGNFLTDLRTFVSLNDMSEPVIKTTTKKNHRSAPTFYCKIQIDDLTWSSYPIDTLDEDSAMQIAAKKALDDLEQQRLFKKQHSLLISEDADILQRIPPMVQVHPCGVWNREIQDKYLKQYNEQLPTNWLEIVDTLPYIAVVRLQNQFVLHFCDPQEKKSANSPNATNVSVLPNTVKFNDDDILIAEITCIASAAEVWCCQRDTPEWHAFFKMVQELEKYYNANSAYEKAQVVQLGGHYVALYEQMWCRVRVFEVDGDDIHCFCIDFGDEWVVKKNNLFNLNKKFASEQAQAFVCRLAGVEDLYKASETSEGLQGFLGKTVQVQVEATSDDTENDPAISVVLYDIETGAPINEQIITIMSIEMALPSLTINTPTEVYITQALNDGTVYVQIRSKGFEHLMSLIEKAGRNITENKCGVLPVPVSKSNSSGTYFIERKEDGTWHRVQIIDWSPFNEKLAQIFFLDTGKSEVVNVKEVTFYALEEISDVISKFPLQGYLVRLSLKSVPDNFVERIEELMPPEKAVLVKSLRLDHDYVPVVEFFKRSESDNILFSVNMTIAADSDLRSVGGSGVGGDGNNNQNGKLQSKKLQRLMSLNQFEDLSKNVPSTGSLTCPKLPEIDQYFDVKIPCAVHPYNFFVQPYESQAKLNSLMVALQVRYKDIQYSPIQICDVSPGRIYASRHKDGKWYRTSVIKVIHSGSISVFYCDFGYYGSLSLYELVPLDDDFMDLPYQAIKAKLFGVQPINSNWSMEDCEYFTKLVCKKSFVSILVGIEKDVLYRSDTILNLKLIDTSTSQDIHIDQLLIERGIAISSN